MFINYLNSELAKKIIRYAGILLLLFCFVYEILPKNVPSVFSSRKIVFLILLGAYFVHGKIFISRKLFLPFCFVGLFFFTIFQFFYFGAEDAVPIYPKLLFFIFFGFCAPHLFSYFVKNVNVFLFLFTLCGFFQSVIVFCQFFSFPFRVFLSNTFASQGNIEFLRLSRATGLGCEGATLGFWVLLSIISCACLILRKESKFLYIFLFTMIIAQFLIAKTGFALSILVLAFLVFRLGKKSLISIIKFLPLAFIVAFLGVYFFEKNIDSARLEYVLQWQNSIFDTDEGSYYALKKMAIPEFTEETLIGTGVVRGNFLNGFVQNDSGYVQTYTGLGLLLSIPFYLSVLIFLLFEIKKLDDILLTPWLYLILLVSIVMEAKETFVLKYIPFFYIYTVSLIKQKEMELLTNAKSINKCYNSDL